MLDRLYDAICHMEQKMNVSDRWGLKEKMK